MDPAPSTEGPSSTTEVPPPTYSDVPPPLFRIRFLPHDRPSPQDKNYVQVNEEVLQENAKEVAEDAANTIRTPIEAKVNDVKGVQAAHLRNAVDGTKVATNLAANKHKKLIHQRRRYHTQQKFNFDSVDDLDIHVHASSKSADCPNYSHHNLSPRGIGDCSLEDIILLQKKTIKKEI